MPIPDFFNNRFTAYHQMTSTGAISLADALCAYNNATGGEVWPGNVLHELFNAYLFNVVPAVNQQMERGYQLAQIVWRDVGCHTYGDTAGAVHQQAGDARWQDLRFFERCVKIVHKVNRFFIQVGDELVGDFFEAGFGVTHCRGWIAVD